MSETWMPIATAPLDGTDILVCAIGRRYKPTTASWKTYHPNAKGVECWRDDTGNKLTATHWMPLPEPPTLEGML